eukprot:m.545030 g.545030  ORF g.545030 m.545030 type:complete len:137 (+) comp22142_c0_seq28:265-675(+)
MVRGKSIRIALSAHQTDSSSFQHYMLRVLLSVRLDEQHAKGTGGSNDNALGGGNAHANIKISISISSHDEVARTRGAQTTGQSSLFAIPEGGLYKYAWVSAANGIVHQCLRECIWDLWRTHLSVFYRLLLHRVECT